MQQAHENTHRGWTCVEPLEILIEQGCAQFELFTGHPAPKKRMTECLLEQFHAIHRPDLELMGK
jgi:shikimate 5-dehydrogenase